MTVGSLAAYQQISKQNPFNILTFNDHKQVYLYTMEEDTEFRDLIIKKLENNGVLLKMKVSKLTTLNHRTTHNEIHVSI